ncbi:MAG: low molecular weight phosphatase family protein [Planctomycetaceae bacterium]
MSSPVASAGVLKAYVDRVVKQTHDVPTKRRKTLDAIAASIGKQLESHGKTAVLFVCTHNSRRSQFAQVWAHAAARYYGVKSVQFWSGGTEATAANIRTVKALRRAGFTIEAKKIAANPIYTVTQPGGKRAFRMFSKVYWDKANPQSRFVAVMCCGDADRKCPVVKGAAARFSLHFVDPKVSDGTPKENETYDERCRQIAVEMFYLLSRIKRRGKSQRPASPR